MIVQSAPQFGALLRRYRKAAGLTQEALAERALLSAFTISALERGANQTQRRDTLVLLSDALGLTPPERAALEGAARAATVTEPQVRSSAALPPLVGRADEVMLIKRHLAGEGPPVLFLAGEPGIGKSRLLWEATHLAVPVGLEVAQGGCRPLGGQEPYAPFPDALRGIMRGWPTDRLRAELQGCAWLVRLLPELAAGPIPPLPAWMLAPEQERHLLFEVAARFLTNSAGPRGLLLLLDDLQWAGSDALELLRSLAEAAGSAPMRIIVAYRDTEVSARETLAALLADLARNGLAAHHKIGPLDGVQISQLLELMLEGREDQKAALRERIVERSGGVPFFALSCVEGLQQAADAALAPEAVPWTVAQSVRQRVAALPRAAKDLLHEAAIVGRVARRIVLLALAERPSGEVLDALDAACHAGLLDEYGHDAYRFAHDIVREVVEAELSAARRAALHQRVGEVLENLPGPRPIEALAYHYAQSDALEKAIMYLERAGDEAMVRSAIDAAEAYYRDLAQRLEALGWHLDMAHAYAKLGLLFDRADNPAEAITALERATAAFDMSRDVWAPAQESASPSDGLAAEDIRAELYLARAALARYQDRLSECMALARRAAEVADAAGDRVMQIHALRWQGIAQLRSGQLDEAVATLGEARRLCEEMDALGLLDGVLHELFFVYELRGEFEQAERCNVQCAAYAEAIGDRSLRAAVAFRRACLAIDTGDWERGRADLELTTRIVPRFAHDAYILANLGYLSMLQGDWVDAAALLAEALQRSSENMNARVMVERFLAEFELLQGRPEAALARLRVLLERDEVHDTVFMLPLAAWAHLDLGNLDEAGAVSLQAVARPRAEQTMFVLPDALRIRAQVATIRRQWTQAALALDEGLDLAHGMPQPYAEAGILRVYGAMHEAKGEPEQARTRLEQALAIFRRLGARWDAEQTELALERMR